MRCAIEHLLQCSPADVFMPFSMLLIAFAFVVFALGSLWVKR